MDREGRENIGMEGWKKTRRIETWEERRDVKWRTKSGGGQKIRKNKRREWKVEEENWEEKKRKKLMDQEIESKRGK